MGYEGWTLSSLLWMSGLVVLVLEGAFGLDVLEETAQLLLRESPLQTRYQTSCLEMKKKC